MGVWIWVGLLGVVLRVGFHSEDETRIRGGHGAVRVKGARRECAMVGRDRCRAAAMA